MTSHDPDGVRLQKVLASAGVGSRRACEELIAAGRVSVDGHRVTELGTRVDPESVVLHVDGRRVEVPSAAPGGGRHVVVAVNKPLGVISAMSDDRGRPHLGQIAADVLSDLGVAEEMRLFHVGRLDAESEGLILMTNDGELAHRLTHPSWGVLKTYLVEVRAPVSRGLGRRLLGGVQLDDGPVQVHSFTEKGRSDDRVQLELVVHEGRNHVVRRLMEEVGHPVRRLVRTQFGPVALGMLRSGGHRRLRGREYADLYAAVEL